MDVTVSAKAVSRLIVLQPHSVPAACLLPENSVTSGTLLRIRYRLGQTDGSRLRAADAKGPPQ